jgi:hypothetical protein
MPKKSVKLTNSRKSKISHNIKEKKRISKAELLHSSSVKYSPPLTPIALQDPNPTILSSSLHSCISPEPDLSISNSLALYPGKIKLTFSTPFSPVSELFFANPFFFSPVIEIEGREDCPLDMNQLIMIEQIFKNVFPRQK